MSSTTNVTGTSSNIPAAGLSNTPANMQINQKDFLQLITAQMKDQNPLSPSDPTQFVTQLEGMSQVSAMQSMQASMQASSIMNGTSLIGHSILAAGTTATLATGVAIGAAGGLALTRYLKSLLYGVTPHDPATLAAGCVLILLVALAAAWLPARRAVDQDPAATLRME